MQKRSEPENVEKHTEEAADHAIEVLEGFKHSCYLAMQDMLLVMMILKQHLFCHVLIITFPKPR